jgi:hypothetical protein
VAALGREESVQIVTKDAGRHALAYHRMGSRQSLAQSFYLARVFLLPLSSEDVEIFKLLEARFISHGTDPRSRHRSEAHLQSSQPRRLR